MRRILAITLLAGLFVIGCSSSQSPFQATGQVDLEPGDIQLVNRLVPFDSCDKLLSHLKEEASDRVGPYGLDNSGYPIWFNDGVFRSGGEIAVDAPMMAEESASVDSSGYQSSSDSNSFTGTNVQELGVDEPDIIKTDGNRILIINNGVLSYIAVNGGNGSLTDQIEIESNAYGFELFIQGDRAFLLANGDKYFYVDPMPEDEVSIQEHAMPMDVMHHGI